LARELGLSQGVVEKRTTIPILSNVLIEANQDRVTLTATDLEMGIRCSCPATVKKAGSGTVPVKRLLDLVRLLPEGEVNVKFGENQWVSLVAGRSKTRMAGMSRESFPELPGMGDVLAIIPAKGLGSMIGHTIFAISAEESRFTLNGALLSVKETSVVMVSTDGHRLAMSEYPGTPGSVPYRALLPRKAMTELAKLCGEAGADAMVNFGATENHLFFQLGERLLISRKLTGNFPDYERVLPREHPQQVVVGREAFKGSVERVAQFSDERSHAVKVRMEEGEMVIHSALAETGESEESVEVGYSGDPVEIGFNAQYMLDFLRATGEAEVAFLFKDSGTAGELRPVGEGVNYNYRYIIMPMRV
jgi:DNA polymerase-3 subunit beta